MFYCQGFTDPFPILKKADVFVLSLSEGMP